MASALRPRVLPQVSEAHRRRQVKDNASGSGSDEAGRPVLLSFDEIPEWFQRDNNQWILHGYRPISGSVRASFRSWWYLHNETVNNYSHLIPAVAFLLGEWYILQYLADKYSTITTTDFAAFSFFMLTATVCYAFSALYHTLMNHSYTVDHFCHRLDMLGIGIFIVGDIVLGVNTIFWCETTLRNTYWFMIGGFGALSISTNTHPKLQSHKFRSMRTLAFMATSMSVVAPLIHGLGIFGLDLMNKKAFTYTMVAKMGCLLPGAALYAMRFPETWWPRQFAMCSSHSFMHILVVCAAVVQLIGYLKHSGSLGMGHEYIDTPQTMADIAAKVIQKMYENMSLEKKLESDRMYERAEEEHKRRHPDLYTAVETGAIERLRTGQMTENDMSQIALLLKYKVVSPDDTFKGLLG